ncbi:MAG TPA: DUF882 domain-containing protein [Pseudolabrys sp.]|nr:DUF882 domain-containing protein [Pseudolabrys sp.]
MPKFARAGVRIGVVGACLIAAGHSLQRANAEGDTRTLSFHHVHSGEDITVTFKRNGQYDQAALKKLDWFMRDWRTSQVTHMDPRLFDLLWETYREVGGTQPIQVIGGYRSPATNAMLHARSSGVAEFSQHMRGHAMDFYIPGVPLEKVRIAGLRLQAGGVGFYPTSGSPFVHMDTGSVRHWPRLTYAELRKVFPDGRPPARTASRAKPVELASATSKPNDAPFASLATSGSDADVTGSTDSRPLAYASESNPAPAPTRARTRPMGTRMPKFAREAAAMPLPAPSVQDAMLDYKLAGGGQRAGSPWLRAAILTPSVSGSMTTMQLGAIDPRPLHTLMHKPAQSVLMTFSADPALGMVSDRFTGKAVVFLATARFTTQTTAALQ